MYAVRTVVTPTRCTCRSRRHDSRRHDAATRTAFSTSSRNVRDASGQRTGSVLAYQDITDLMQALRVKVEFVASVSHELRTPLTGILGYLELIRHRAEDLPSDVVTQVEWWSATRRAVSSSIVRSIGEAHGGEVALTSEVGVGSTVVVRLRYSA